jgi:hypothetical protein
MGYRWQDQRGKFTLFIIIDSEYWLQLTIDPLFDLAHFFVFSPKATACPP